MEVFKVINTATGFGLDPENIKLGVKLGVIPSDIKVFAGFEDFSRQANFNVPPPAVGDPKFWRDNSVIWQEDPLLDFVFFQGETDNFSDESFNYYSPTAARTYKAYFDVGTIKKFPRLRKQSLSKQVAGSISFKKTDIPSYPVPVGKFIEDPTGPVGGFRCTFPSDCIAVFADNSSEILVYKIEDFIKAFPIKNISVGPGPALTDEEFVGAARNIINSAKFTDAEKRGKIKSII